MLLQRLAIALVVLLTSAYVIAWRFADSLPLALFGPAFDIWFPLVFLLLGASLTYIAWDRWRKVPSRRTWSARLNFMYEASFGLVAFGMGIYFLVTMMTL